MIRAAHLSIVEIAVVTTSDKEQFFFPPSVDWISSCHLIDKQFAVFRATTDLAPSSQFV